jgi:hypothetical protein
MTGDCWEGLRPSEVLTCRSPKQNASSRILRQRLGQAPHAYTLSHLLPCPQLIAVPFITIEVRKDHPN